MCTGQTIRETSVQVRPIQSERGMEKGEIKCEQKGKYRLRAVSAANTHLGHFLVQIEYVILKALAIRFGANVTVRKRFTVVRHGCIRDHAVDLPQLLEHFGPQQIRIAVLCCDYHAAKAS